MSKLGTSKELVILGKYDFIAIDFETANSRFDSACAIGIAAVRDGKIEDCFYSLINPHSEFDPENTRIHGITKTDILSAPDFETIWRSISDYFGKYAVLAHNARFDMSVLKQSHPWPDDICDFKYIDTMSIAKDFVSGEKSLAHCAECLNIDMGTRHNALDDAKTCANIALCCMQIAGASNLGELCFSLPNLKIHSFFDLQCGEFVGKKKTKNFANANIYVRPSDIKPAVSCVEPTGKLYGKTIVFTGELSIGRSQAMQLAVDSGAILRTAVSRKTDYLVVGIQDIDIVGKDGMSTKEEKAHAINDSGTGHIEIIDEAKFMELVGKETDI